MGGNRGRLISAQNRHAILELIDEAVSAGAGIKSACMTAGISDRTYERWKKELVETGECKDMRPHADHSNPHNKLSDEERQKILEICSLPEYADSTPEEIVADLADKGIYIASERTFYRVLKDARMLNHRGRTAEPERKGAKTHTATAPNQVWTWDITYLRGPIKGMFFYLYLIIDIFSRDIVGWEVWPEESGENAAVLARRASLAQGRLSTQPLVLHSDNGSPMKAATMLATLYALGITPSNSRPRVSNDNAYSESLFRTLKYRPCYQTDGFKTIDEAREWCRKFVHWYRNEHHHSGIGYVTPAQRHAGLDKEILAKRNEVYENAKSRHPERWGTRKTRQWTSPDAVTLNPEKVETTKKEENAA